MVSESLHKWSNITISPYHNTSVMSPQYHVLFCFVFKIKAVQPVFIQRQLICESSNMCVKNRCNRRSTYTPTSSTTKVLLSVHLVVV